VFQTQQFAALWPNVLKGFGDLTAEGFIFVLHTVVVEVFDFGLKVEELFDYVVVGGSCRVWGKWHGASLQLDGFPVHSRQPGRVLNLLEVADTLIGVRVQQVCQQFLKKRVLCHLREVQIHALDEFSSVLFALLRISVFLALVVVGRHSSQQFVEDGSYRVKIC
jgi:hypothetical protein